MDNNINIKFQNITKEKLDAYWKNKPEEDFTETVICGPLVVFLKLIIFYRTVSSWFSYIWPYLNKTSKGQIELVSNCSTALILVLTIFILLCKIINILSQKIFHNYDIRSRYQQAQRGLSWAKSIFHLQALLKEKNIKEISWHGSDKLEVKYVCKNGITEKYTADLGEYYDNVVKEDCLDFTWMDDEINKILIKNKLPEIEN